MKKKSFARSAVLMGFIILLSKLMGLVRDQMIASAYGTTDPAIAYETASRLPVTLFDFVLGGVVTSAFIPVYSSLAVKKGKNEALSFANSYVNLILLITLSLTGLGIAFAPGLMSLIAPELSESTASLAVSLTRIMFPMVIFVGLAFSFVGFLQSEGEYNIPALISLVSNLIMVGYLLFFNNTFGIVGLAVSMLLGWGAQAAVQLPAVRKRGFRYRLLTPLATPEIKQAAKNTLPILIATWTTPLCSLINTSLASGLNGGRAIGALGYANRLYIIIVGLFSFVATNLLFPYFSRAAAEGKKDESDRLTRTSLCTLTYLIAPIAVGVIVLAEPFVALIYQNGSFNASDTAITAEALRCYAVGMVFAAVGEVLTKAFFAVEKTRLPMIASVLSMAFNVAVILLLRDRLTVGGIALVSALAAGVSMAVNWFLAVRHGLMTPDKGDALDLVKSLLSALVMGIAVYVTAQLPPVASAGRLAAFAIPTLTGAAVYALCTALLHSRETMALLRTVLPKKQ